MSEDFHDHATVFLVVSWDDAKRLFEEYCIFMVLHICTEEALIPSKRIEIFWNFHMTHSRDYRDFCLRIFGDFVLPKVYSHNQKGIDQMVKDYKRTIDFYTLACEREPNPLVWRGH
jgi:hypothetical protein